MDHPAIAIIHDSQKHGQIVVIKCEAESQPATEIYTNTIDGTAAVTMKFPDVENREAFFNAGLEAAEGIVDRLKQAMQEAKFGLQPETVQ